MSLASDNEAVMRSLDLPKPRISFGTGTPEELLERAWPHIQVLKRKKRMRKKVRRNPTRYMRGSIARAYASAMIASYTRMRMREDGFAVRLMKEIRL